MTEDADGSTMEHLGGDLSIRWMSIAIAAVIVALASLTVLAVVASIRDADVLSVVALALAILAFVVQIIVYIVQSASATRQEVQMTEIYGRTLKALNAIEEKSEGTRRTVTTISDRLLDAAIGKAIPESQASGLPVTSPALAEDVSKRVREIVKQAEAQDGDVAMRRRREARVRATRSRVDETMRELPPIESVGKVIPVLKGLGGAELRIIRDLGEDQTRNGGTSSHFVGPGLRSVNPFAAPDLVAAGLIVRRKVPWSQEPVFQLTDLGKDAARILMSSDEKADRNPHIAAIRNKLKSYDNEIKKLIDPNIVFKDIPVEDDQQGQV